MTHATTALNTGTKALLEICGRRGIRRDDLLNAARIDPSLMEKYNHRIPADKKRRIWEEAFRRTGDEQIGFCASQAVPFGGYGVLDYLLIASSTPAEVLSRVSRFYRLINNFTELRLETHKSRIMVELHNPADTSQKMFGLSAEFSFGVLLSRLQTAYGRGLHPEKVSFTHPLPAGGTALHLRLFQSEIRFGQPVNRLIFSREMLNVSLSQSDEALAEVLEHQAQRLLKNLPLENDITGEVRAALRSMLGRGSDLNTTAKALAMSGRNLQRKLNSQGTCYREVLDKLRYEIALDYLAHEISISEITRLLGFSETSAFQRAFKRWSTIYSQNL